MNKKYCTRWNIESLVDGANEGLSHVAVAGHPLAWRAGALARLLDAVERASLSWLSSGPVGVVGGRLVSPAKGGAFHVVEAEPGVGVRIGGGRKS